MSHTRVVSQRSVDYAFLRCDIVELKNNMLDKILKVFKNDNKKTSKAHSMLKARFDAAGQGGENSRHWLNADSLSADAAASYEVRKTLRERSRYETSNNSYAFGALGTLADYTVGSGAKLQLLSDNKILNGRIEKEFSNWAKKINLSKKLRIARIAKCRDGEVFIKLGNNPKLTTDVKLDITLIEADCVTNNNVFKITDGFIDGIVYDKYGNPTEYQVLKNHPGSDIVGINPFDYDRVPAEYILHYMYADRPGQHRGVPEITSALPLYAQTRRYSLATLSAAEAAADFAAILYTDNPASGESEDLEPLDEIELRRNMLVTAPAGWKLGQMDAKQPTSTYKDFSNQMLHEIARCLKMPFCLVYGDFGGANYASGRMDFQTFYKTVQVEQATIVEEILDPIFSAWLQEYKLLKGVNINTEIEHTWFWNGLEHVDPNKEANATDTRLRNCTTTYAAEYAKQGRDWEKELAQVAIEKKYMAKLGITPEDIQIVNNETGDEE